MEEQRSRLAPHLATTWAATLAIGVGYLLRYILPASHAVDELLAWLVAVAAMGFGVSVFLRDGGARISAVGAFALSVGIFVGFALVLVIRADPSPLSAPVTHAATLALGSSMASIAIVRRRSPKVEPVQRDRGRLGRRRSLGFALLLGGVALDRLPQGFGPIPARMAYVGVVLLAAAYVLSPSSRMRGRQWIGVAVGAVAGLVYLDNFFRGSGRLVVATMGFACLLAVNAARPSKRHKHVVVLGLFPALMWFGALGSAGSYHARDLLVGQGLKAFYAPVVTFGSLITAEAAPTPFPHQHGGTFVDAAVFWVPRAVWDSKPDGFGTVLTEYFHPGLLHRGHSMAALGPGEWYGNFGLVGMALSVPLVAIGLGYIDRRWLAVGRARSDPAVALAAGAIVVAGLANYVWVGTFTFAARDLVSAGIVLVLGRVVFGRSRVLDDVDTV